MSTITREQLRERAREKVKSLEFSITQTAFADSRAELEEELELARIALASLEAKPVAATYVINGVIEADDFASYCGHPKFQDGPIELYANPPAPVSVPDLKPVGFLFVSDDGAVAYSPADWPMEGFNLIGQIYGDVNACRAAMLQGADGNSPAVPEWHAEAEKMAELHGISFVVFRHGESPKCADPSKVIISFTDEGLGHGSAAPQQEVKP
ncbi:hypothetical protein [Enterobacter sp. SLBN-59]|uniref:hypothetical protein n=1 Tax=Enterobacter sp. SLBN-59 TaxID=2940621 RepID=UPI002167C59F|nr:hypothetical protein [Enterobacter sp. SLBN-59]MCS3490501.1 hypothetical protein [Enterobacter sp. SLBN-59]